MVAGFGHYSDLASIIIIIIINHHQQTSIIIIKYDPIT